MSKKNASEPIVVETTAVTVLPPSKEDLEGYVNRLPTIIDYRPIKNEKQYEGFMEKYRQVGELSKELEKKKESVLGHLKAAVKNFNALFKPYEEKIAAAENTLQLALNQWVREQEDKRKAELAKIENDKRLKNPQTIQTRMAVVTPVVSNTFYVEVVKIIDLKQIPLEYFTLDEAKVKAAHKAGITIPGVTVEKEKRVRR